MIKSLLSAAGLGLAGYVIYSAFVNDKGIGTASGEGGIIDAGIGQAIGGFLTVGSVFNESINMNISTIGLSHIKGWEKLRLNRYLDEGGKPTIGYGHLILPHENLNTITETEATGLLLMDLSIAIDAVNKGVKQPITQANFDGLVSLAFNIGAGAFLRSTLLRLINKGDIVGAQKQFGSWVYVGKKKSNGLINRRTADLKLFKGVA